MKCICSEMKLNHCEKFTFVATNGATKQIQFVCWLLKKIFLSYVMLFIIVRERLRKL